MKRILRSDRAVLGVAGEDAVGFLQGLVSNDIARADGEQAVYAALLTPQGKFLYDLFVISGDGSLLLDCPADDVDGLIKKLTMYKLRAKVTLENLRETHRVVVCFGDDVTDVLGIKGQSMRDDGTIMYPDPRLDAAGVRAILPLDADPSALGGKEATEDEYQHHRIALGLPETPDDLIPDKSILLESGFDELHGIDWSKGCYMGQELTARTKYRGLVKKRLVPLGFEDGAPVPGASVTSEGKNLGEVRSVSGDVGLAMLKLDAIQGDLPLEADGAKARVLKPDWLDLSLINADKAKPG